MINGWTWPVLVRTPLYLYSLETHELPAVYPVTCPLAWLWWRPFLVLKLFSSCRNSCSSYVSRYFRIHLVKPRFYIKVGYSRCAPVYGKCRLQAYIEKNRIWHHWLLRREYRHMRLNLCLGDNSFRAFSSEVIPFI